MRRRRSRLERITVVTGVLAAITVVSTLAAAVTLLVGPPGDPARASATGSAAGAVAGGREGAGGAAVRRVVRDVPGAGGLRVGLALPDEGWSAPPPDTVAGYRRPRREALVVTGPVFFRRGWCADDPQWSSRAFAGVVPRVRGASPRGVGARLTRAWARTVASVVGGDRVARGAPAGSMRARASPVLVDGHPGWRTTRSARLSPTGPCLPPRVSVDVLSLDVGGEVVAVLVVRDVGVPDALTRSAATRFLHATRVLPQSLRNRT